MKPWNNILLRKLAVLIARANLYDEIGVADTVNDYYIKIESETLSEEDTKNAMRRSNDYWKILDDICPLPKIFYKRLDEFNTSDKKYSVALHSALLGIMCHELDKNKGEPL